MLIPATRFSRGEQIADSVKVSDDCAEGFKSMQSLGCRLTAEILSTGHISCCIEHPRIGDFACSVTPNGPEVIAGIEKMLKEFSVVEFGMWRRVNK